MKEKLTKNKGITLIALVITIIILLILSGITIKLIKGEDGIFNKAQYVKEETNKQTATEKISLKITEIQIDKYEQEQRMPILKELSLKLKNDKEIEYVKEESQNSIYIKLNQYPYEFEINSSLQIVSIDGIKIGDIELSQIEKLQNRIKELEEENIKLKDELEIYINKEIQILSYNLYISGNDTTYYTFEQDYKNAIAIVAGSNFANYGMALLGMTLKNGTYQTYYNNNRLNHPDNRSYSLNVGMVHMKDVEAGDVVTIQPGYCSFYAIFALK